MNKLKLAVVGKDVSKSVSPEMHMFIAKRMGNAVQYDKLSVPEEEFELKIDKIIKDYDGLNVTIPYKLSIIPHLNVLDGDAEVFGAVNTVTTHDLHGNNTDGAGFSVMLENNAVNVSGKLILLLGAGGAGRSVAKKLIDGGAEVYVFDKFYANVRSLAKEFAGIHPLDELNTEPYFMIVNATGVGMHKTEGVSPVGEELLSLCEVAVDLIYTPPKSKFLEIAEVLGKKIINGEGMLFYQAYFAECIFFGVKPDNKQAKELFEMYVQEVK